MTHRRLPSWLTQKIPVPEVIHHMDRLLREKSLHTVCESALCPNMGECFSRHTATFMILGDTCTRRCTFCAIKKGSPTTVDEMEPFHILEAVKLLGLRYVVITSVTRDDLPDGGAFQFARTTDLLHQDEAGILVEVLIPDFCGSITALNMVVKTHPEVINHNIETIPRLYKHVRPIADFYRSLRLLSEVKMLDPRIVLKSGLMVGLGETKDEIIEVMRALIDHKCDILTIGQYLQPSPQHHPVVEFLTPEQFAEYERLGLDIGFRAVASAPLVRSSYRAAELYRTARLLLSPH